MDLNLKHVLVDTCFLIHLYKYSDGGSFDDLLLTLKDNKCTPVINELIRQEFVRLAASEAHYKEREEYISKISSYKLPLNDDIWNDAILISQLSNFIHSPIKSITDSVIMAQLKKWENKLLLITSDVSDFQQPFINRFGLRAIDVKKEVITIGFHQFDTHKFEVVKSKFEKYKPKI